MPRTGAAGELVLRVAADGHHEIVADGTFLMDTRDGRSERGLVTAALEVVAGRDLHVLVAGLGVGFSLGAALASSRVARVTVVELEPAVVELVTDATGAVTGADLTDPRVELLVGDLVDLLDRGALPRADVVCLDVDNGPGWTLSGRNAALYERGGVDRLTALVGPGGALAVWSAHDDEAFAGRLAAVATDLTTHTWTVPRGEPDRVWVARGPFRPRTAQGSMTMRMGSSRRSASWSSESGNRASG